MSHDKKKLQLSITPVVEKIGILTIRYYNIHIMQYIIPYLQQISKNFRFSSKTNTFHQTEDWGARASQSFIPLTPWATKWLMRLACTGRWNLSEFSKVWREMIRVTANCRWVIGRVGDFSPDDIQEIQQASDFGTTRTDLKYRGNVFWREVSCQNSI